ncbi:TonB-dependent receptor [Labilibaculum sp. K2S]|uniref:TonB-dependent receptor n=1 Tax=Labilibaculum sp. K2S TaxID=3056386 RepID=UPI0025A33CFC|nr:TonB-dependent receptor [Labilibaculum sp. K2S]MDM8160329.1 TonB-dependent receptor [Labilibaculum sp. K2S]
MIKQVILVLLLSISSISVFAQKGSAKGNVKDGKTGEALTGASVYIEGTTIGTVTDFDGNYTLPNIPAGVVTLKCSFISYESLSKENITVKEGNSVVVNFAMGASSVELNDVVVIAKANRESEIMLLVEQKKAVLANQAIGAQEISRKGAGDAEAAVTKVSGIAKQEGAKNVFVRGLGDRFNFTTLNGFPITSEDPEYKNISLDFFSSDIIKAVGVKKVFNAESQGDATGAIIDISSKELVGASEFNLNVSAKANSRTLTEDFFISEGISELGFGENTSSPTDHDSYAFKNSLDPSTQNFQLGKSFGFSGGKHYEINNNPLSFYVIGTYSNDYTYHDGNTRETTTSGNIFRDQKTEEYIRKSSHLGMANVNYQFGKNSLSYNLVAIHTAKEGLRDDYGKNSEVFQEAVENMGLVRRQQNNINFLLVNQLDFEKEINKHLSTNIGLAYNHTNGKEPDRRVNYLSYEGDNIISPLRGSGRQHRYFNELKEDDLNVIAKVKYKFSKDADDITSLEVGYKGRFLNDDFKANSWDNSRTQSTLPKLNLDDFSLNSIFNHEEFAAGHFQNEEYNISTYSVDKTIHSIFSELNYQLTMDFILNVGLKTDIINLIVDYNVNDGSKKDSHSLDEFYLLPNLNLKYNLNEQNTLRLGASRTYTLPQSKEISPMLYEGPQWSSQGNTDLNPSVNYNVDLKWDFYPSSGELISVTAFGKFIKDPISRVQVNSAGGFLSYANIADNAKLAGIEIEMRKNLFSATNQSGNITNKLSAGLNFSYLNTDVKTKSQTASAIPLNFTEQNTELEGASPEIANGDLSYNYLKEDFEFTASIVANYVSEHIYSVGVNGYKDINEESLTTLDFISSIKMNKHWGIKLKAKNLLDPEHKLSRDPSIEGAKKIVLRNYKKGIDFSFGISYHF